MVQSAASGPGIGAEFMAPMATLDLIQLIHDLLHMGGHILALVFASGHLFHDWDWGSIITGPLSLDRKLALECLGGAPHHMERDLLH